MTEIAPAVKKETKRVAMITIVCVAAEIAVFAILHFAAVPEKVPFDYRVILGAICGGAVAVLNFFLMGLTVQKVSATEDETAARARMKTSYTQRMLLQIVWLVAAIAAPCFFAVAGIIPLLFPSFGLKLLSILGKIN